MRINKFYKGSSTFKCKVCERRTRDTGAQSVGNKICPQCYELAGIENEISDGHCTFEERRETIEGYIAEIVERGGNDTEWQSTFESRGL